MGDYPIVNSTCGLIKGKISKAVDPSAKVVHNFLGIPYGKSTAGKRRFLPPQKMEPWQGTFHAVQTYKNCPQNTDINVKVDELIPYKNGLKYDRLAYDEDCLKLNLFTPECDDNAKKPVMVWFTGGHYQRHTGGRFNGTALSGMNDVVTISLNHRVNAFGFLSLGKDSCCPGNVALLDAILALEWIRDNVHNFGGDPQNITLFGESSGSAMVNLLMLSPLSRKLFHKAILASGTVLTPFLFAKDLTAARDLFLARLNLDAKTMEDGQILQKLQALPVEAIMEAQKDFNIFVQFGACVDGHVMCDTPEQLIKAGHVSPVPMIIGCTNSEGFGLLPMFQFPNYEKGLDEESVKAAIHMTFDLIYKGGNKEVGYEMIKKYSMNGVSETDPHAYSILQGEIFSDAVFIVPMVTLASAHVARNFPTYMYQISQRMDYSHSETNGPEVRKKPHFTECDHSDDLHFIWGVPFLEGKLTGGAQFTDSEIELSRQVMRYFSNFARSGNPNKPLDVEVEWPAYHKGSSRPHLVLRDPLKVDTNLGLEKTRFYTKELPQAIMQ